MNTPFPFDTVMHFYRLKVSQKNRIMENMKIHVTRDPDMDNFAYYKQAILQIGHKNLFPTLAKQVAAEQKNDD